MIAPMPETDDLFDDADRMRCPDCGCGHHRTVRTTHVFGMVRRERACRNCGRHFYTREEAEPERAETIREDRPREEKRYM